MATGRLIFVEKRHRLQVLRMLIMRRGLYTGESGARTPNFKQIIRKKIEGK